jgi:hypothetical protein
MAAGCFGVSGGADKNADKTMRYKSQLLLFSSCESPKSFGRSWPSSTPNLQDVKLLSPWLDYNSNVRPGLTPRVRWNTVLGLALATAVGASIWTGIILMLERIWK